VCIYDLKDEFSVDVNEIMWNFLLTIIKQKC
jgi:hypothetical protein